MVAQKNIIKKIAVTVNTQSLSRGTQLKDELSTFLKDEIFPAIDAHFNSIQKKDAIIRFEKIEIEIGVDVADSNGDLKNLILNELKKIINTESITTNKVDTFKKTTVEKSELDAFIYFLEFGILPWWCDEKQKFESKFFRKIKPHQLFLKNFKTLLTKPQIRKRLMCQFDDEQLAILVSASNKLPKLNKEITSKIPKKYRNVFWETVLYYLAFKEEQEFIANLNKFPIKVTEKLLTIINKDLGIETPIAYRDFQKLNTKKKFTENSLSTNNTKEQMSFAEIFKVDSSLVTFNSTEIKEIVSSGILVKNAGLILLHPFLKMFFKKLDFLTENDIKPEKIDEAIHILHYLATGREQPAEHEVIFEKFICNIPLFRTINRQIFLTEAQKNAANQLLKAVLEHWTTLKSNSIEILQNEFLQRDGKLTITNQKQNLFLQRKTQDLLLDRLPWNIHLVKLPWHDKILFVNW